MDADLVKDVLEALKELRYEMHDNAEASTLKAFDAELERLEQAVRLQPERSMSAQEILGLLGTVVRLLPVIQAIIGRLSF